MLFETKSEVDIHEMSPLALAFVGDAVLELLVRARLVGTTRLQPNRLHTVATHYVSAHAQNRELELIEKWGSDKGYRRVLSFVSPCRIRYYSVACIDLLTWGWLVFRECQ